MTKTCLVIPCYNSARHLEECFRDIPAYVHDMIELFICIDDGSTDDTGVILRELQSQYPLKTITHEKNQGYGAAQKSGFEEALRRNCDVAIVFHSDGQMDAEQIPVFLSKIDEGYEFISGSRLLDGGLTKGGMPFHKQVGHHFLTGLSNLFINTSFHGYGDGFRAYHSNFLKKSHFQTLSDHFEFDTEMFLAACLQKTKWAEIPVPTIYQDEVSELNCIKYGLAVVRVLLRYRIGRYHYISSY